MGSKVMGSSLSGSILPSSPRMRSSGADVDDLSHQAAALGVIAHQFALQGHGQLVDERGVHKFRAGGVPARLLQFPGLRVARGDSHIVAGHQLLRGGHADGEGLPGQDIGGGLVPLADAHGDLAGLADAAPGGVHGVGSAVLPVGGQDQHRLGIGPGLGAEAFYA